MMKNNKVLGNYMVLLGGSDSLGRHLAGTSTRSGLPKNPHVHRIRLTPPVEHEENSIDDRPGMEKRGNYPGDFKSRERLSV